MPQLNTLVYFHEYAWLFFTFFIFYFIFIKYLIPGLATWIKLENKILLYHLSYFKKIINYILSYNVNAYNRKLYKLVLCLNVTNSLKTIYNLKFKNNLFITSLESNIFNILKKLK